MGTVRYTVVNGEVLSELRNGVKRDYVPDPLGSTVALLDSSQNITDTFSYWPYGESAGRTGTTATPFQFVGTMGYYTDSSGRNYVRARYLDKSKGRWITEDVYSDKSRGVEIYEYTTNNPISFTDFSGMQSNSTLKKFRPTVRCDDRDYRRAIITAIDSICDSLNKNFGRKGGGSVQGCFGLAGSGVESCLANWCNSSRSEVVCSSKGQCAPGRSNCAHGTGNPPNLGDPFGRPHIGICVPWDPIGCHHSDNTCDGAFVGPILHEMIGNCGSSHTNWAGKDPCDQHASCVCGAVGLIGKY